jgi:NAD(P)-dependent dehydrogenase (short-subunit alcohol dehydrogenase family)
MPHDERLAFLTDDELETIAPDYIWVAEMGDEAERLQFAARLDQLVAEAKRRGKPEIIARARASLIQPENPSDRAAAREEN